MKPQMPVSNGAGLAVRVQGNGFYYAIRHFLGEIAERRHQKRLRRRAWAEIADMPAYIKDDIGWPPAEKDCRK